MAQPLSILNTRGQSTDTPYGADGVSKVKLSVGSVDVGLTPDAAWQGVATHMDGDAFAASDGIVVVGGVDGTTPRKLAVDSNGNLIITTSSSSGSLENGAQTLAGSAAEALSSSSIPCQGVLVKAASTNLATIYVGKSDVTTDFADATGGYPLEPGESVGVPCRNVNTVYVRGTTGDKVAWLASAD